MTVSTKQGYTTIFGVHKTGFLKIKSVYFSGYSLPLTLFYFLEEKDKVW